MSVRETDEEFWKAVFKTDVAGRNRFDSLWERAKVEKGRIYFLLRRISEQVPEQRDEMEIDDWRSPAAVGGLTGAQIKELPKRLLKWAAEIDHLLTTRAFSVSRLRLARSERRFSDLPDILRSYADFIKVRTADIRHRPLRVSRREPARYEAELFRILEATTRRKWFDAVSDVVTAGCVYVIRHRFAATPRRAKELEKRAEEHFSSRSLQNRERSRPS